jgi:hypothetical protein
LYEKRAIDIAEVKQLTKANKHFNTIFGKYAASRSNLTDMYSYLNKR